MRFSLRNLVVIGAFLSLGCTSDVASMRPQWAAINSTFGGVLRPPTDKLDGQCSTSGAYDACIFEKNPTSQEQKVFKVQDLMSLDGHRKFGIKLVGLDNSGFLRSSDLQIQKISGESFEIAKMSLKSSLNEDSSDLEALMAYYWVNRAYEFYRAQTGGLALEGHPLKIVVDDAISGFKTDTQSILLAKIDRRLPMAFDATVVLHLLAQANIYWASGTEISNYANDSYHRTCRGDPKGCCTSALGCSRALVLGSADYFVATIFPDSPQMAETWSEALQGQSFCGVQRSLATNAAVTVKALYTACKNDELGRVEVLGLIYASIWWNIRGLMASNSPSEVANIDRLHQEHLKELTGSSRFDSALKAIENADQKLFSGRYSELFRGEFRKRGL